MGLLSVLGTIGGNLIAPGIGGAIGGALGGAIEGNDAANAAQAATGKTAAATDRSIALQQRIYEEGVARQQPWLQAGQTALNKLIPVATEYTPFSMQQFQQDPGYQFRLGEGLKALDRQAAARGGLISGSALKAAQRYGQEAASQEYQNAFNRYQSEREARLNPLQSLAGVGQTTAQQVGQTGQQYGQNISNALMNQAYTAGNADIGAARARQSMYGDIGSALGQVPSGQWQQASNYLTSWLNPDGYYPYGGGNLDVGNMS